MVLLKILNEISARFKKLYIISFVIGFGALLAFILIKLLYRRKDKPKIAEITEAAIPTNINQNNNMLPLGPMQQQPMMPQPMQPMPQQPPFQQPTQSPPMGDNMYAPKPLSMDNSKFFNNNQNK